MAMVNNTTPRLAEVAANFRAALEKVETLDGTRSDGNLAPGFVEVFTPSQEVPKTRIQVARNHGQERGQETETITIKTLVVAPDGQAQAFSENSVTFAGDQPVGTSVKTYLKQADGNFQVLEQKCQLGQSCSIREGGEEWLTTTRSTANSQEAHAVQSDIDNFQRDWLLSSQ